MMNAHNPFDPLLEQILKGDRETFAIVCRGEACTEKRVEVLAGIEHVLASIDEVDQLIYSQYGHILGRCMVVAPYKQISERGYQVVDDDAPLIAIEIKEHQTLCQHQLLATLPDVDLALKKSGFVDSDEEYKNRVEQIIRDEIGTGQGANFVIKRTFSGEFADGDLSRMLTIFRNLISKEVGAYWTFIICTNEYVLIGASPERHISLSDGKVSMMPISGTYRYPDSGPSAEGIITFLNDKKEENELFMVVDEELKMMTRICQDEVSIEGPFLIPMSKLLHTGYLINGRSKMSVASILKQSMFAPTVTGSPIENAARVIVKYEPEGRSYYSGFAALIETDDTGPTIDSCILIRTLEANRRGAFKLSVGATLVRGSQPESELAETNAKVAAMKDAMGISKKMPVTENAAISRILLTKNQRLGDFWLKDNTHTARGTGFKQRVVILDNEDSFTSMMHYQLRQMGYDVTITCHEKIHASAPSDIVIVGPGPGDPRNLSDPRVRSSLKVITAALAKKQPFAAICFGHQILCHHLGLSIEPLPSPNQGVQKSISFFGKEEVVGFYNTYTAKHSKCSPLPYGVDVSFDAETGQVFGLRGHHFSSMQFHPESILTIDGPRILQDAILSATGDESKYNKAS